MVAELLRLKLQVLGNEFRRAPGPPIRVVAMLLVIGAAIAAATALAALAEGPSDAVRDAVVPLGALLLLACVLFPIISARDEPMRPRAFVGYGIRPTLLSLVLPLTDLVSLPALVVAILLYGFVAAWAGVAGASVGVAVLCAICVLIIAVQLLRLATTLGARLEGHRHGARVRFAAAVLLLAAIGVVIVPSAMDPRYATSAASPLGAALTPTPLGSLFAAPGASVPGTALPPADAAPGGVLLGAVEVMVVLWVLWRVVVGLEFRAARPTGIVSGSSALGVFGGMPATPLGTIAARSLTYWVRDPRYSASLAILPVIPIAMLVAMSIGGIPLAYSSLVPLPVMVLIVAWATSHNDVAYDSEALWSHVAARTRGWHDRLGRAVPAIVAGSAVIAIGAPLTVWLNGDPALAPAVVGISVAVLLGSIGLSSAVSATFPYAAPPPSGGAFEAPQTAGTSGGAVQSMSFFGVILVAAPAVAATAMWFTAGGSWSWWALLAGAGAGALVFIVGVAVGARAFERRGPELLAFAVRH